MMKTLTLIVLLSLSSLATAANDCTVGFPQLPYFKSPNVKRVITNIAAAKGYKVDNKVRSNAPRQDNYLYITNWDKVNKNFKSVIVSLQEANSRSPLLQLQFPKKNIKLIDMIQLLPNCNQLQELKDKVEKRQLLCEVSYIGSNEVDSRCFWNHLSLGKREVKKLKKALTYFAQSVCSNKGHSKSDLSMAVILNRPAIYSMNNYLNIPIKVPGMIEVKNDIRCD
jgi:hypothetical protein